MKQKLISYNESSRTSLDEACQTLFKVLVDRQKPYSMTGLAKETRLHRQTVEKCINLFWTLEKAYLDNYRLKVNIIDKKKVIELERRTGLLSYPLEIQRLIIKTQHFPLPTSEGYALVYLYLKDATSPSKAIPINTQVENEVLERLLRQGQIKETTESEYYLTDEGIVIAKGTLRIFPELEAQRQRHKETSVSSKTQTRTKKKN